MKLFKFFSISLLLISACLAAPANWAAQTEVITAEVLGVYFTPPSQATSAIVNAIEASEQEVLVQAYGFTHKGIAKALISAHQRGVRVLVLLDQKSLSTNGEVIKLLEHAQIAVRQDGMHAIAHNKVMVIDDAVVITGSFNFTHSAASRNAENFLILKSVALAQRYKAVWQDHWAHASH